MGCTGLQKERHRLRETALIISAVFIITTPTLSRSTRLIAIISLVLNILVAFVISYSVVVLNSLVTLYISIVHLVSSGNVFQGALEFRKFWNELVDAVTNLTHSVESILDLFNTFFEIGLLAIIERISLLTHEIPLPGFLERFLCFIYAAQAECLGA